MRLVTYADETGVHIGALRDSGHAELDAVAASNEQAKLAFEERGEVVPLDAVAPDMLALIDGGEAALAQARAVLERAENVRLVRDVTLLAPIPRPRQNVICLGMNYVEHAIESQRGRGQEPVLPKHPVFFTKAVTTICGPEDTIPLDPAITGQLDYEVELAFIIGRTGKNIAKDDALGYVWGYTIINDVSARDLQSQHLQFYKGKSLDRTCPMGPCIVTADEIPDPAALGLRLRLNGETRQDSSVSDLIFDIPSVIEVYSRGTTVEAGTVFATGTPSGVGLGRTPPEYMQAGDVMEAEVDKIGVLRNTVVAAE